MAATYGRTKAGRSGRSCGRPGMRREEKEIDELAEEKLGFFGQRLMGYRWDQPAYSPLLREPAAARDRARDGDRPAACCCSTSRRRG